MSDSNTTTRIDGLSVCSHRSDRFSAVRFVEAARLDPAVRALFTRPSTELPHLAAVFVDPRELSFRTFENIVPLDRLLTTLDIRLEERKKLGAKADRFSFRAVMSASTRAALERLDGLELYQAPLNAASRGGVRYIFHSAQLAEALTTAVKAAFPRSLLGGFSHVNPVFRCNRFEPGDDDFHAHLDTPYFDAARDHVSRYTLLLYLTGGRGAAALSFDDLELAAVEPFTCVIFDQRHEHAGAAYEDGRKVFLRTELVYEGAAVSHEPAIAELFSKACYLTGESAFHPELARDADDYYNRVAAAHWQGWEAREEAGEPFLHKQWRGVHFLANGYDYWFPRQALSLEECAALTLLDYFNCTIDGAAFRTLCTAEVVRPSEPGVGWIDAFLARFDAPAPEPLLVALEKAALFPPPEEVDPQVCCPFHAMGGFHFDATRCEDVLDVYRRAQDFAKKRILPAPVMMMGEEVFLDPERFVVRGNAIHVLSSEAIAPVNFAACWNWGGHAASYIDVAATVGVLQPLVPPILFTRSEHGYHLMFDFFRNSWMAQHRQYAVPVPQISLIDPADAEDGGGDGPWMEAVDGAIVKPPVGPTNEPWWGGDSPVVQELYAGAAPADDDD